MKKCERCIFDLNKEKKIEYKKNDYIFFEGDLVDAIYHVIEGSVKLEKLHENGEVRIMDVVTAGDYLALLTVLKDEQKYIVTAMALNNVILTPITKEEAYNSYVNNLHFKESCLKCAANRLGVFQGHTFNSANTDPEIKIMSVLKHLASKFGRYRNGQIEISMPINKTELANMVGLRRETLSRKLKLLQEQGALKINKNLYIIDSM